MVWAVGGQPAAPHAGPPQGPDPPPGLSGVRVGMEGWGKNLSPSLFVCYLEVPALHQPRAEGAALQFDDLMTMAKFNPLMSDLRMLAQRRSRLQRRSMAGGCIHRRLSASGSNLRWWWIRCSINRSRRVYPCCWRSCRRRCGEMLWGPATFGRCPSFTAFMW